MVEIELNNKQTKRFWNDSCEAVGWDILNLDNYLCNKYTIIKRQWTSNRNLILTIEDEQYATWLLLYL